MTDAFGTDFFPYLNGDGVNIWQNGTQIVTKLADGANTITVNGLTQLVDDNGDQMTFGHAGIGKAIYDAGSDGYRIRTADGPFARVEPLPPQWDLAARKYPSNVHFVLITWSRSSLAGNNPPESVPLRTTSPYENVYMLEALNWRDWENYLDASNSILVPAREFTREESKTVDKAQPVWGLVDALVRATRGERPITIINLAQGGISLDAIFGWNGGAGLPMTALDEFLERMATICSARGEVPIVPFVMAGHSAYEAPTELLTKAEYKQKLIDGGALIQSKVETWFTQEDTDGSTIEIQTLWEQSDIREVSGGAVVDFSLDAALELHDDAGEPFHCFYSRYLYPPEWKPDDAHLNDTGMSYASEWNRYLFDIYFETGVVPCIDMTAATYSTSLNQVVCTFSGVSTHGDTLEIRSGFPGILVLVDGSQVEPTSFAVTDTDEITLTFASGTFTGATTVIVQCGYNEQESLLYGGSGGWNGALQARRGYTGIRVRTGRYSSIDGREFEQGPLLARIVTATAV
jgi:hypothetical protein